MSAWILGIAGVCILSVLMELLLTNGQTARYIKNIFAFVMVLVIISPLPALAKGDFNLDDIFQSEEEIVLQDEFIMQVNRDRLSSLQKSIIKEIAEKGILDANVAISADVTSINMEIKEIFVDLSNVVINSNIQHKDIKKVIVEVIKNALNIKEEQIIFDG